MKMLESNYYYYFVLWWLLGNQQLTITTELLMSKSPWGLLKVSSFKKKVSSFMKFQLLISCSSDHYRHLVFLVDHPYYDALGLPVGSHKWIPWGSEETKRVLFTESYWEAVGQVLVALWGRKKLLPCSQLSLCHVETASVEWEFFLIDRLQQRLSRILYL